MTAIDNAELAAFARDMAARSRAAQGLPAQVDDPLVYARICVHIRSAALSASARNDGTPTRAARLPDGVEVVRAAEPSEPAPAPQAARIAASKAHTRDDGRGAIPAGVTTHP